MYFQYGEKEINYLKSNGWQIKKSDEEAIQELCSLKGIGVWTAEMILLFCLQRPDILSYNDLAIQRGLRMVYHHRQITKELFAKYKRRFSPCGSVASLYLRAIACGAIEGMRDYKKSVIPVYTPSEFIKLVKEESRSSSVD